MDVRKKQVNIKVLVACLAVVYLSAFIGSLFTTPNTGGAWYLENKPRITPPGYVFPIVWNILFFLIALSMYFAWINVKNKKIIFLLYGWNLALNMLWSFLFFSRKLVSLAFYDLLLLLISTLLIIAYTYKIDKKASYLLIPYLLWLSFAGVLNYLFI